MTAGVAVETQRPPTLIFDGSGRVNGFSGVNRFGGSVESANEGQIRFGQMMSTKMAGPPEQMTLESSFLAALARTDRYAVADAKLNLTAGETTTIQLKSEPIQKPSP